MFVFMDHRTLAIIETIILLGIIGALIIYLLFNGHSVGDVSFITGK